MELQEAIQKRHSVRGYLPEPVDKKTIEEILRTSVWAVSGVNSQPWEFAVVAGDVLEEIRAENALAFQKGEEPDLKSPQIPEGVFRDRAREIGQALFTAMDIGRRDLEKRRWWSERGFRFFDAPCVILILVDEVMADRGIGIGIDIGAVVQNICLAAWEKGLGTCVEEQAVNYQKSLRRHLQIPAEKRFVTGIAIGYPDPDFPANAVRSTRVPVGENTKWFGFSDPA